MPGPSELWHHLNQFCLVAYRMLSLFLLCSPGRSNTARQNSSLELHATSTIHSKFSKYSNTSQTLNSQRRTNDSQRLLIQQHDVVWCCCWLSHIACCNCFVTVLTNELSLIAVFNRHKACLLQEVEDGRDRNSPELKLDKALRVCRVYVPEHRPNPMCMWVNIDSFFHLVLVHSSRSVKCTILLALKMLSETHNLFSRFSRTQHKKSYILMFSMQWLKTVGRYCWDWSLNCSCDNSDLSS